MSNGAWSNDIFKTQPLSAGELAFCFLLPSTVFVTIEIEKWLMRRGLLYRGRSAARVAATS